MQDAKYSILYRKRHPLWKLEVVCWGVVWCGFRNLPSDLFMSMGRMSPSLIKPADERRLTEKAPKGPSCPQAPITTGAVMAGDAQFVKNQSAKN